MPKIGTNSISPFWQTTDKQTVKLFLGNVTDVIKKLPEKSVQCVVTSPPYWGLRDYGVDGQIGSEATPDEFVQVMVEVFREVRRVLRDDGTLWLNLGDTYASSPVGRFNGGSEILKGRDLTGHSKSGQIDKSKVGVPQGNLIGIPWRVALALQSDGWILRQDIIWHKPSVIPESIKNRCTKAHEYVFLFAKQSGYYYDAEAIKEKSVDPEGSAARYEAGGFGGEKNIALVEANKNGVGRRTSVVGEREFTGSRNKRSVWTISSGGGYSGNHFATFPTALVEPCLLAGTSEYGCCVECGSPYRRILEEKKLTRERPNDFVKYAEERGIKSGVNPHRGDGGRSNVGGVNSCANSVAGVESRTVGWEKTCQCKTDEVRPCVVLDPFIGSGTTNIVAIEHGRWSWGIDLSKEYLTNHAVKRVQSELLSRPALAHLAGLGGPKVVGGGKEI